MNVQSKEKALLITEKLNWKWFSKDFLFTKVKKRNFDTGLDDGFVTPCLVPEIPDCNAVKVKRLVVPDLESIGKYGFSAKLEIEPREWEKNKILGVAYPKKENKAKRIEPAKHFPLVMNYIENDAESRGDLLLENPQ